MFKHSTKWTPQEIEELRDLAARGVRPSMIAHSLGRSVSAVRGKAIATGIGLVGERSIAGMSLRPRAHTSFLTRELGN